MVEFWDLTVGQFQNCVKGYNKRLQKEMRMQDTLNFVLGQYIATGVNNPKKYPKKPRLSEKEESKPMSNQDLIKAAKAMTRRMGGVIS